MTADKRTVTTDALETLGSILVGDEGRDAIHLAVEPVIAAHDLSPGDHVGFAESCIGVGKCKNPVGIVDPFITQTIKKGEKFWLVVYPRQITSLRHVWEHPAFPLSDAKLIKNVDKNKSEDWLRDFCSSHDCPDYETVMQVIEASINGKEIVIKEDYGTSGFRDYGYGKYLHFDGTDGHALIPNEFWDHVENVLGKKVPYRADHFSCSC